MAESFVTCTGEGILRSFHYSKVVFEQIRATVVDKFLSIPRGGLEVGGVLFGRFSEGECTVIAHRPIAIEYRAGPAFRLSETDEATLARLLEEAGADPDLAGLEPVGWYHSHTRTDLSLTPEDLEIHRRFFPRSTQIALVLKPFKFEPVQAAVYVGGAETIWNLFHLDVPGRRQPDKLEAPSVPPPPVVKREEIPATVDYVPPAHASGWLFIASCGMLATILAAAAFFFQPSAPKTALNPQLHVTDAANQLTIDWNSEASWVKEAESGELHIRDGQAPATTIPLDRDFLRRGSITYGRTSGNVDVRLVVRSRSGEQADAAARFVGAAPTPPPTEPASQIRAGIEKPRADLEKVQAQVPSKSETALAKPPDGERARVFPPQAAFNVPAKQSALPNIGAPEPPSIEVSTSPQHLPVASAPRPATPPPAAVQPPSTPAVEAPQSGRAIWTGSLPPGGHLLLEGRRISSGNISGRLPQRPARMTVYPADLGSSGVVVYTSDDKSAVEPPSAANGWNLTAYRKDLKRSRTLTVLERPGPQNGWRKLMVRAEDRPVTMLVIQWEELPAETLKSSR